MALFQYNPGAFRFPPIEKCMARVFNDALREVETPLRWVAPYWLDMPDIQECNIGNALGKIERHFIRKYTLPEDAQLDSLESHLSDKGVLSVCAKKAAVAGPPARSIPIQPAPKETVKKAGEKKK
uniref:SHSP domain-containing protein n=1 Tax=Parascaris equorum TaxID=6256 RepID=A0A914R585_PAREQ